MTNRFLLLMAALVAGLGCSCGSRGTNAAVAVETETTVDAPDFNADSAYAMVKKQVDMGPRVPGTSSHARTADWLATELYKRGADTVIMQRTTVTASNGDRLPICNIMGRYNVDTPSRVLLVAHWDTRPWADAEEDVSLHSKPIPGANDGASGVGVLLEIARLMGSSAPETGVDILFVDAEDYGDTGAGNDESWCLGTQYWVDHTPYGSDPSTRPRFGILLDLVGGTDARFHREPISDYVAPWLVDKVWSAARKAGYGNIFVNQPGSPVMDDHFFINRAGIPTIDIIESVNSQTGSFPPTWHTLNDDMASISRTSLKAVGQTVTNVIYALKNTEK